MDIPDAELVCQCINGEKDAFSKLVHKYQGMVHALAYHLIGNFEDAKDITQLSFTKAYLSLSTLKEKDKFASWLRQITTNECRILLRSPSRKVIPMEDIGEIREQMTAEPPDVLLEKAEQQAVVREAVSRLPADYRLCVVLFYLGGLSYHEISTFMNISLSTVKWRLHRAKKMLVEISVDGSNWDEVASGTGDMDAYVCVNLPPAKMRYIKITQTGYCMPEWWSIYDIHVYMPVKA